MRPVGLCLGSFEREIPAFCHFQLVSSHFTYRPILIITQLCSLFILCLSNSPKDNYKTSVSSENTDTKQKTKQRNYYYIDNNNNPISAIYVNHYAVNKKYIFFILNAINVLIITKVTLWNMIKRNRFGSKYSNVHINNINSWRTSGQFLLEEQLSTRKSLIQFSSILIYLCANSTALGPITKLTL
jgi:hypothetical protein